MKARLGRIGLGALLVLATAGYDSCGPYDASYYWGPNESRIETLVVSPGDDATVLARIATGDEWDSTIVEEVLLDTDAVEVIAIDGEQIALRGVAIGEATLTIVGRLSREEESREQGGALRVVVADPPRPSQLVGSWRHASLHTLHLREDGTYLYEYDDGETRRTDHEGRWSLAAHDLTLQSDDGTVRLTQVLVSADVLQLISAFPRYGYDELFLTRLAP